MRLKKSNNMLIGMSPVVETWLSEREKMKIGVYKFNWIVQRDSKFEVHKERTKIESLAVKAGSSQQTRGSGRQWIREYANKKFVAVSLSITDME